MLWLMPRMAADTLCRARTQQRRDSEVRTHGPKPENAIDTTPVAESRVRSECYQVLSVAGPSLQGDGTQPHVPTCATVATLSPVATFCVKQVRWVTTVAEEGISRSAREDSTVVESGGTQGGVRPPAGTRRRLLLWCLPGTSERRRAVAGVELNTGSVLPPLQ